MKSKKSGLAGIVNKFDMIFVPSSFVRYFINKEKEKKIFGGYTIQEKFLFYGRGVVGEVVRLAIYASIISPYLSN